MILDSEPSRGLRREVRCFSWIEASTTVHMEAKSCLFRVSWRQILAKYYLNCAHHSKQSWTYSKVVYDWWRSGGEGKVAIKQKATTMRDTWNLMNIHSMNYLVCISTRLPHVMFLLDMVQSRTATATGAALRKKRIPNFLQNTKIVINGSPQGRFEHLGVETAWKIHARHGEHSEIIN